MDLIITFFGTEMNEAVIQYQDNSGNWVPVGTVPNQSPLILQGMRRASDYYHGNRVRAVDVDGRVLDIL